MPNRTVRAAAPGLPKIPHHAPPTEADFIDDLAGLPKRYGLLVVGSCLDPLVPDGATILVDKTAPYAPGDLVVIYRSREATPNGRFQGLVKRLVMAPPPWVTFPHSEHPKSEVAALVVAETLNPRQQIPYRCSDIIGIHRCLGLMPADVPTVRSRTPKACRRPLAVLPGAASAEAAPDEKLVTAQQLADMEFEPWLHTEDEWKPPSLEEWTEIGRTHLVTVRIAWHALYRSKAQLENMRDKLGDDEFEAMIGDFGRVRKFFEGFRKVIEAAEIRIMAAEASTLAKRDEIDGA